jgi:WD40 repeat protein
MNVETGVKIGDYPICDERPTIEYSPDGNAIAVAGKQGIGLYGTQDGSTLWHISSPDASTVAFSPDGKYVTWSGNFLNIADAHTGKMLVSQAVKSAVVSAAFSFDDRYVMTGNGDNSVSVWSLQVP